MQRRGSCSDGAACANRHWPLSINVLRVPCIYCALVTSPPTIVSEKTRLFLFLSSVNILIPCPVYLFGVCMLQSGCVSCVDCRLRGMGQAHLQ